MMNGSKLGRGKSNHDSLNVECSIDFLGDRVVVVTKMGVLMLNGGRRGREVVDAGMTEVWKRLGGCWRRQPN
jgi:hypothetical protein